MELRSIFDTLLQKSGTLEEVEDTLKKAMIFEANYRLVRHPYDLIGIRRQKYFEDALEESLKVENCQRIVGGTGYLKQRLNDCIRSVKTNQILIALKILTTIVVITTAVTVNDYYQDYQVINLFRECGDKLEEGVGKFESFTGFKSSSRILLIVMIISSAHIVLNLPSLWYRFKVSMQMKNRRAELEFESVDPGYVVNQFNIPIAESRNESTLQMMIQWGVYYNYAWYITWYLKLNADNKDDANIEKLEQVDEILTFSKLFPSYISSVFSLTYGQFLQHGICYKYRTSVRKQLLYLFSSGMNVFCIMCVLLTLQVAIFDNGVEKGYYIHAVALMMITPFLSANMILPTSND